MKQRSNFSDKKKDDPLNLSGKYPYFPLDPGTYRNHLWERNEKLMAKFITQFKKDERKETSKNKTI
jgi:hypothetical protein